MSSFWLDVTKTFIGALLGAGLAFTSTLLVQWRVRRQDNIKAGNLALTLLRNMLKSFLSLRAQLLQTQKAILARNPGIPPRGQFKPTYHPFIESTSFDLSSLAFLFDKEGVPVVDGLFLAESIYDDMRLLLQVHREAMELIQARQHEGGLPSDTLVLESEFTAKIGSHNLAKANDLANVLISHIELDEVIYREAFKRLRTELVRRYGDRFIDISEQV